MGRLSTHYECALCDAPAPTGGENQRFLFWTVVPPTSLGPVNPQPSCTGHADFMLTAEGEMIPLGRSAKLADLVEA